MASRQPAPLSQEFSIVLAEQRVGRPLAESLDDLRRRVGAPELDLMNTAMNVSRRVGGNLADTLESLARTLQEKAHMEGKIDALTSMGRAQGWVVGLLPVFIGFVLYQQQPARMSLLFTQWYGWVVLAIVGDDDDNRRVADPKDRAHRCVKPTMSNVRCNDSWPSLSCCLVLLLPIALRTGSEPSATRDEAWRDQLPWFSASASARHALVLARPSMHR